MKRITREWVRKAEEDYAGAVRNSRARAHDLVCFLCQQSAEKYMKALLEEGGVRVPYTHDLGHLAGLVAPYCPDVTLIQVRLRALSESAVKFRYPGARATARQSRAALRTAREARRLVRLVLGLKMSGGNR